MGDPTAPRFVYWKDKLRATPSGPVSAVFGDFLSFPGKIRAGLGAVGLFKAPPPPNKEESVKEFISRNLGPEVFQRLIEPFCSGVYAGNPENLSMKGAFGKIAVLEEKGGSLMGGALELAKERKANPPPPRDAKLPPKPAGQTVASFRKGARAPPRRHARAPHAGANPHFLTWPRAVAGLQTLPAAIAAKVEDRVKCNWKLTALKQGSGGLYELTYDTPDGARTVKARSVGLTAPSYVVAELLQPVAPEAAAKLGSVDYPPVCAVTLAYPESAIKVRRLCVGCLRCHLQVSCASCVAQSRSSAYVGPVQTAPGMRWQARACRMSARRRTAACRALASCTRARRASPRWGPSTRRRSSPSAARPECSSC